MQVLLALLWGEHMDGLPFELPLFLVATFAGGLVAGLSGFAFGLVAASLWLYILTPLQSATLIVAFGLIVQGYSVWKLRHALDWRKLWPFVLGAAFVSLEVSEFAGMLSQGNGPSRSAFLSAFFALVGTHGIHVTVGLCWLAIMMAQIATLGLKPKVAQRLVCFSLFWHALDLVWIGVFTIVYLGART